MPESTPQPSLTPPPPQQPGNPREGPRPWRTEGLPRPDQEGPQRTRWPRILLGLLLYFVFFGVLSVQDWLGGPETVSYTEFKTQVAAKNVEEVFARGDSIQGQLRKSAPLPNHAKQTYKKFITERLA